MAGSGAESAGSPARATAGRPHQDCDLLARAAHGERSRRPGRAALPDVDRRARRARRLGPAAPHGAGLVRLLAVGEETALSLAEIAARLGVPGDEARRSAANLYRAGIVARDGDDAPLPV